MSPDMDHEAHLLSLEDAVIDSAINQLNGEGGADTAGVAVALAYRLARIYDLHLPADASAGRDCWCPECGEIGPYPNPCTTSRLVMGDPNA